MRDTAVSECVWLLGANGDESPDGDEVPNLNILDELIPVTVDPADDDVGNTFIKSNDLGSISGAVFEDSDGDETLDVTEWAGTRPYWLYADEDLDGLPDTTVVLDSVLTDPMGIYVFLTVVDGAYVLVQDQPGNFNSVDDFDATPDGDQAPNVSPVDNIIPVSLGVTESDGGNVFIEELGCSMLVSTTADSGTGSLRDALACAAPGDTIFFSPHLAGDTILITSTSLTIDTDVTLWSTVVPRIAIRSEVAGAVVVTTGDRPFRRGQGVSATAKVEPRPNSLWTSMR